MTTIRQFAVALFGLVLLAVVPSAAAQGFTPSFDVRDYDEVIFAFDNIGDGAASQSFQVEVPHDFLVLMRESWFTIEVEYTLQSGVGFRNWEFTFETTLGHSCSWRAAIGSSLQAVNVHRTMVCTNGSVDPGEYRFWINATAISGGNPVQWYAYGITLHQREQVDMSTDFEQLTSLTGIEFLAVAGAGMVLLVVGGITTSPVGRAASGVLAMVLGVLLFFFPGSAAVWVLASTLAIGGVLLFGWVLISRSQAMRQKPDFFDR